MLKKLLLIGALTFPSLAVIAEPATEASINELMAVTDTRKMVDALFPQMDQMMRASMQEAFGGRELTADERQAVDSMVSKLMNVTREELSWDKLQPLYVSIYQESFTQEEIEGIVAFYKTPAGAALVRKMPVVMQNSMKVMQQKMGPMMAKVQSAIQETVAEIQARQEKKG